MNISELDSPSLNRNKNSSQLPFLVSQPSSPKGMSFKRPKLKLEEIQNLTNSLYQVQRREKSLEYKLDRFNHKMNTPSAYYKKLMSEKTQRQALNKEILHESRRLLSERKVKETREANERIKHQCHLLQQQLDEVNMPIIEIFKDSILKQKVNAFKRTMKGYVEREVNEHNLLPSIMKQVEK